MNAGSPEEQDLYLMTKTSQYPVQSRQGVSCADVGWSDRLGWVCWLTLNNRRQSVGPKPDSRPRLEGARYKYLTSCSCLLTPPSPFSHAHIHTHHQPDSSPPGLAQWACYIKASAYGSRVGWTPARTIHTYTHPVRSSEILSWRPNESQRWPLKHLPST